MPSDGPLALTGPSTRIATAARNATVMLAALAYWTAAASDPDTIP